MKKLFYVGDNLTYHVGNYLSTGSILVPVFQIFNFENGNSTLVVEDSSALDREHLDSYKFEVIARDNCNNTANTTVVIALTDVNDNVPIITTPM